MEKGDKNSKKINNDFGLVGVVLGIVSLVNSLFVPFAGIVLGITGIIFGFKQRKVFANKWSYSGIILNILGIIIGVIVLIVTIYILANFSDLSQIGQLGGY